MATATVLVIDDERMIRWSMEQTLRAAGYDVAVAATAAEGIRLFRRLLPEVVFLDVRLPDENGLAVLKRMKDAGGRTAAVIVMTAFEENCTAAEATRLGARQYLKKPFDFDTLEGIVRKALAPSASHTESDPGG